MTTKKGEYFSEGQIVSFALQSVLIGALAYASIAWTIKKSNNAISEFTKTENKEFIADIGARADSAINGQTINITEAYVDSAIRIHNILSHAGRGEAVSPPNDTIILDVRTIVDYYKKLHPESKLEEKIRY